MSCLSIKKAAEIMGVSQQKLRIGIQRGRYPFGIAQPAITGKGMKYTYDIYPGKFVEYYPYKMNDGEVRE